MKKLFVIGIVLLTAGATHAQCNKTVTWTGSKTEYLDAAGNIQKTDTGPIIIQTAPGYIHVTYLTGNGTTEMIVGDIKNATCNWNEAYQNGKTSFKSSLSKPNGETKEGNLSIEAKDGKIIIMVELENMNGMKMRIPVDSYKEES